MSSPIHHRQSQLDAILQAGTARSTSRAYSRDIRYFWAWATALSSDITEHYPVNEALIVDFILDHLGHMQPQVEDRLIKTGLKRKRGPLKVSTLRRLLASISVAHSERGAATPTHADHIKLLLRRAQQTQADMPKQQQQAITREILAAMINSCDESLHGVRDKAILLLGFASGGRRRSELVNLTVNDLSKIPEGYLVNIRRSKTDQTGTGLTVAVTDQAAAALTGWLIQSGIRKGYLFRGIRGAATLTSKISGNSIHMMIKRRIASIGLDPSHYGAHSLRAGFLTESTRAGNSLSDTMALSGHKDMKVANAYIRQITALNNPAVRLLQRDN